jgi:hypothetical protein
MSRVGFEPTIPTFQRADTVHALDRAAIVIGLRSVVILFRCNSMSHLKSLHSSNSVNWLTVQDDYADGVSYY